MEKYKNFINNKWIESESKETIKVDDPSNGKIIGFTFKSETNEKNCRRDKKGFKRRW